MAKLLKFSNGLCVCYERKRGTSSCAFGIYVNAGSRDEDKNASGIAHFIEHMLFKGTEKRTAFEIADELDKLGANSNAYTSKTNTVYYVSGLAKFLPQYMEILSDMFFHSTFTEENMERERGVILEEIKMYDDDGDSVCADLLNLKYFGKNSLARPILGTEKSVKSLDAKKIRDFMEKYYLAKNVGLSYCGPASEEELRQLVEIFFESEFNKKNAKAGKTSRRKVIPNSIYATRCDKPFEQANVHIRFPAFPFGDKRAEAILSLAQMLGGGMSSRLFQKIREEKGLVYEIYSASTAIKGAGYLDIGFATAPKLAEEAIMGIREVIEEIRQKGFGVEEFEKAIIQRETAAVLGGETTFDIMRLMGKYYTMTGKPTTFRKLVEKMKKLSVDDVNKAFKEVFDYEKSSICYVGKPIEINLAETLKTGGLK